MKVMGDLVVKRGMFAEVRADRGLRVATIVTDETLDLNSYSWQKLKDVTAADNVILPDATTLKLGWAQVIENDSTSTYSLSVKDGGAGAVLQVVAPGEVYEFVCQSIGAAAGVWRVVSLENTTIVAATRYTEDFDATTDWGAAGGGYYTITITGATHTRGLNPTVIVFETAATVETRVDLDISYDNTTGDISLVVPETPDCRFAGRALII